MKRSIVLSLVLLSLCICASASAEVVAQMTYTVVLPDVTREGLYTGEVQEGVPHGYGVFHTVNANGVKWHYLGEWVNGEMCGKGGQYWDSGYYMVGSYEHNDMIDGKEYSGVVVPAGEYIAGEDIPAGSYTISAASALAMFSLYESNGNVDSLYTVTPDSGIGKISLSAGQVVKLSSAVVFSPYIGLGFK